jgi:hypothetical protein
MDEAPGHRRRTEGSTARRTRTKDGPLAKGRDPDRGCSDLMDGTRHLSGLAFVFHMRAGRVVTTITGSPVGLHRFGRGGCARPGPRDGPRLSRSLRRASETVGQFLLAVRDGIAFANGVRPRLSPGSAFPDHSAKSTGTLYRVCLMLCSIDQRRSTHPISIRNSRSVLAKIKNASTCGEPCASVAHVETVEWDSDNSATSWPAERARPRH